MLIKVLNWTENPPNPPFSLILRFFCPEIRSNCRSYLLLCHSYYYVLHSTYFNPYLCYVNNKQTN